MGKIKQTVWTVIYFRNTLTRHCDDFVVRTYHDAARLLIATLKAANVPEQFQMIPLGELSVLEITCSKCATIVALKVNGEGFFSEQCPTCHELPNGLSGKLAKALTAYGNFYREINGLGLVPHFRIKLKDS